MPTVHRTNTLIESQRGRGIRVGNDRLALLRRHAHAIIADRLHLEDVFDIVFEVGDRAGGRRCCTGAGDAFTPKDGTYLGQLFESLATLSVRVFAGPIPADVSHLRLGSGRREIDLIVERGADRAVVAFDVKLSSNVTDSDVKHLLWLRQQLGHQVADIAMLTAGENAYRRRDGVAVVPLGLLGA